ncbi:DUF4183 domain-containing protein [Brevibacillus borstelensis]|uniref:DUF4183 domain-containing protein n=1 Tax=Brevibacillus borstelensis TaxID=45462 RepID=UPI003CC90E7B
MISASQFVNDDGSTVVHFPVLQKNSYLNLFINGIIQEGKSYVVEPNALTINAQGGAIYARTPITIEVVRFTVEYNSENTVEANRLISL